MPSKASTTGTRLNCPRRCAIGPVNPAGMCWAMTKGTRMPSGKVGMICCSAAGPPVEHPMTTKS